MDNFRFADNPGLVSYLWVLACVLHLSTSDGREQISTGILWRTFEGERPEMTAGQSLVSDT